MPPWRHDYGSSYTQTAGDQAFDPGRLQPAFADLAVDPEGSLTSYNSATKDLSARIKKQIDAFELKYGDFLVEITIEEDTEDDW